VSVEVIFRKFEEYQEFGLTLEKVIIFGSLLIPFVASKLFELFIFQICTYAQQVYMAR